MPKHAPPPLTEPLQEILHYANEPIRLFLHLLYQTGDTEIELSSIAALGKALQEAAEARTDAIFRVVDKQVGVIKLTGVPDVHKIIHETSQITATLEKPKQVGGKINE